MSKQNGIIINIEFQLGPYIYYYFFFSISSYFSLLANQRLFVKFAKIINEMLLAGLLTIKHTINISYTYQYKYIYTIYTYIYKIYIYKSK